MKCPKCNKDWLDNSEQSIAIQKRGKCIACIIKDKEKIEMNPYEFSK